MEEIQHKYIEARGVRLHIAEIGSGSTRGVVVFVHGFPEIWYTWRHQMVGVGKAGFHAIAPDLRGYGLSGPHPHLHTASFNDFVEDTLAILDFFNIQKVIIVGKDFGAWVAYSVALKYPKRVCGVISLGVPFFPPQPRSQRFTLLPEGFYMSRWREPGRAEADFQRFDVKTVLHNIYILFSRSEIPIADKDKEVMDMVDPTAPLPPWLTEDDLNAYASLYRSGFESPMQVPYRAPREELGIEDPKVEVPVLVVMGGKDYFMKFPGIEEYLNSGKMMDYVAHLELIFLPEATHFMQEQLPDSVNQLIIDFLAKNDLSK